MPIISMLQPITRSTGQNSKRILKSAFRLLLICHPIYSAALWTSRNIQSYMPAHRKTLLRPEFTLVIIKEEVLGKVTRPIPTMLDYRTHIKGESMFNTPPVFAVFAAQQTLRWLKELGGVKAIQKKNIAKAKILLTKLTE